MSYDPIESALKGATEGFLKWGEEFVKKLASKFKDRKLAFIQDEKTIKLVKEQYNSGELSFYNKYVEDKEMLFLLKMGLTLRSLEKDKDEKRKMNLRDKIFNKYEVKGLHIAQFVENGILNRYIPILLELIESINDLENQIEEVLKNIESHSLFVRFEDRLGEIIRKSINITDSHKPRIFVISGEGICATIIRDNFEKIAESLKDYSCERISTLDRECLFFKRKII